MAREFRLPDIGEGLTEAEIVEWKVAVGDTVAMDQVVVEVATDKAVVELPTPFAGVVLSLGAQEGEVVEVGTVLVVIGDPDGDEPSAAEADGPAHGDVAPIVGTLDTEVMSLAANPDAPDSHLARPRALPVVRKLARDLGVDLDRVVGTGPDGRITRGDVEAAAGDGAGSPEPDTAAAPAPIRQASRARSSRSTSSPRSSGST